MKRKILMLASFLPMLCAGFMMTSCNDDDPVFGLVGGGFVIQATPGTDSEIRPYMVVNGVNEAIASLSVEHGGLPVDIKKYATNIYVLEPSSLNQGPRTSVNGTYNITATSAQGSQASSTLTYAVQEEDMLGDMTVEELVFDGTKITAKLNKVENARYYSFSIIPEAEVNNITGFYYYFLSLPTSATYSVKDDKVEVSLDIYGVMDIKNYRYQVSVSAVSSGMVLLESYPRIIEKGAEEFNPDPLHYPDPTPEP